MICVKYLTIIYLIFPSRRKVEKKCNIFTKCKLLFLNIVFLGFFAQWNRIAIMRYCTMKTDASMSHKGLRGSKVDNDESQSNSFKQELLSLTNAIKWFWRFWYVLMRYKARHLYVRVTRIGAVERQDTVNSKKRFG